MENEILGKMDLEKPHNHVEMQKDCGPWSAINRAMTWCRPNGACDDEVLEDSSPKCKHVESAVNIEMKLVNSRISLAPKERTI